MVKVLEPPSRSESEPQKEWIQLFEKNGTAYRLGRVPKRFFEKLIVSPYISRILASPLDVQRRLRILEAGCGSGRGTRVMSAHRLWYSMMQSSLPTNWLRLA